MKDSNGQSIELLLEPDTLIRGRPGACFRPGDLIEADVTPGGSREITSPEEVGARAGTPRHQFPFLSSVAGARGVKVDRLGQEREESREPSQVPHSGHIPILYYRATLARLRPLARSV